MPEITCFIQLPNGNDSLTIMLDTAISFDEFNNEMKEQLERFNIKAESLKYSYIDEEGDQISFASNEELQEAFSQALKQPEEYFVILIDEIRRQPEETQSQQPSSQPPQAIPVPQPIPEVVKEKEEEEKKEQKPPKNHFEVEVDLEDILKIKSFADILKLGTKLMKDCPLFDELEKEFKKQHEQRQQKADSNSNSNAYPNPFAFGGAAPFPFPFPFVVPDCNNNNKHPQQSRFPCNNNNANHNDDQKAKPQLPIIHPAVCDNCNLQIVGVRYKCLQCVDFDFCERCEAQSTEKSLHNPQHVFAKINKPRDALNVRGVAPSPSPSCRGPRFYPFMCVPKPEVNVEKQKQQQSSSSSASSSNDNSNSNNMDNAQSHPRNRFQCRVGSLQQRVDALESQLSEIKQLIINNNNNKKNNNDQPREDKKEENVEVDSPVVAEEKANPHIPETQKLNEEEERSYRMLKEMGFDLSPSIVMENKGNINSLVENLFGNL